MSSGLFHSEWYTNPPWDKVSLSWLLKYVNNVRTNPVLARALAADRDQFEMVPMPKEVIEHLASARSSAPAAVGFAAAEHLEAATSVAQRLARALESRNVDAVTALLSPNYLDAEGRNAAKVTEALTQALGAVGPVDLEPVGADDVMVIGGHIVANVRARLGRRGQSATRIELVLEKGGRDWQISGLRTL